MGDLWSPANTDIGKRSGRPSAARIFNANRCALPPRAPMPPPPGEVSRQAQRSRDGRGRGTRGRETRSRAAEGVGPYGGDGRFLRRGSAMGYPAARFARLCGTGRTAAQQHTGMRRHKNGREQFAPCRLFYEILISGYQLPYSFIHQVS